MTQTNPPGVFVTGTDTGVGKTLVSAALLAALRSEGCDAVPMKPIQTGCVKRLGLPVAPDLAYCLKTSGLKPTKAELSDMAPYCFRPACSPHLAAIRERRPISRRVVLRAFGRLSRAHECVVVEGAGGVMVPLNGRETLLTLMVAMGLPVLLVARAGLGTLNHTLLSIQALRHAKLNIMGVVLNQTTPGRWGLIEEDNVRAIEQLGAVRVLACIQYGDSLERIRRTLVREKVFPSPLFREERRSSPGRPVRKNVPSV